MNIADILFWEATNGLLLIPAWIVLVIGASLSARVCIIRVNDTLITTRFAAAITPERAAVRVV